MWRKFRNISRQARLSGSSQAGISIGTRIPALKKANVKKQVIINYHTKHFLYFFYQFNIVTPPFCLLYYY